MKQKLILSLAFLLMQMPAALSQTLFTKYVYPASQNGDATLEDAVLSAVDTGYVASVGHYLKDFHTPTAINRSLLTVHDSTGTYIFGNQYVGLDGSDKKYNTFAYSVTKTDTGYLFVGKVTDNSYSGSTAPGGGDVIIISVDNMGAVLGMRQIDLGGNDVAYSITPKNANLDTFFVCGSSLKTSGFRQSFVLCITSSLSLKWVRQYDLRITSGTALTSELLDVICDGTNVWGVGYINTTSTNPDGLVLKVNVSGTYQLSRRAGNGTDRERFEQVALDGSNLVITGDSRTTASRMIALKYITASNTVNNIRHLKNSTDQNIGYDIKKITVGGTTSFFVAGRTKAGASPTKAMLYKLNSSFLPTAKYLFSQSGNTEFKGMDVYAGSNPFIAPVGYTKTGSYNGGYVVKTDLASDHACNDAYSPDTTSLSLTLNSLLETITTTYDAWERDILVDTLYDSLLCTDTLHAAFWNQGEDRLTAARGSKTLYPNPVKQGAIIHLPVQFDPCTKTTVFDHTGRKVATFNWAMGDDMTLNTQNYTPGLYIVQMHYLDGIKPFIETYKFVVE